MSDSPPDPTDFHARAWETVGRAMTRMETDEVRYELDDRFHEAIDAIDEDELTAEDINALRSQLDWAREFVEEFLTPLVDDAERWDEDHRPNWEWWFRSHFEDEEADE